ncbi:hypothetical protein [Bradyrhizobium sp. SZCCHNRI2049]|uniref:hypothetical protein n=1 Tax=Bradyrhizobium sp. SZCCHNRI2049 TaxID=3057287 RepID=UPI002916AB6C|nr:hypothetical protein [Bradyrhizobium sp. SZCCHNRI2049]
MSNVTHPDALTLRRARAALAEGDPMVARRYLATLEDTRIAGEIDAVIRAGDYEDALLRLERFIHPKFQSSAACLQHAGSARHFRKPKEGELL